MNHLLTPEIAARVHAAYGERGAAWVRELPQTLASVAGEWRIAEDGPPFARASASLVLPVRRDDGAPLVLKLAPPSEWLAHEAHALAHWQGGCAVRLEATDLSRGAVLLERVLPGTPLATLCPHDDRAATAHAADAIARLRAAPGRALRPLPPLASWTERLAHAAAHPELARACREAHALAADLFADAGPMVVLHGDLHHHNLLRAGRVPWLAIDPKGLTGPAEAEPAALLRNPRRFVVSHPDPVALLSDRLDILAECLGDDPRRLAGWGYVLAVLAAAWAAEDGDDGDVRRWLACAGPLRAVARVRGAL